VTGTVAKRINIARLVLLYVRKFEDTDPKEALHYFYFLRHLRKNVEDKSSANLFMSCVSELVLESREFDLLLGQILADGSRSPGLVDKFHGTNVNVHRIIELVAEDSEAKGMFEDSVRLYDLAKKHDKVIELLNKLLAQVISLPPVPESRRDRLQRQAIDVAKRYRANGYSASEDGPFFLLLDLMTFFDLFHSKKLDEAIDIIAKIKVI
jgi:nuclear pore complex protein Nup93